MRNTFAVSRFLNCNGVTSWRVAGWLHGVRIGKNLKTYGVDLEKEFVKSMSDLDRSITANANEI